MTPFITYDDVFDDYEGVRGQALAAPFFDWEGPDGAIYKRIAHAHIPRLADLIEELYGPVVMLGMGIRLNYGGELPNQSIHSDVGWGTHAAVVYLCDGPGGTAFWKHTPTNATRLPAWDDDLRNIVAQDVDDGSKWEQVALAELKPNRAVFYESEVFHSRWPFEAFGDGAEDGRLILVAFFTPLEVV